MTPRSRILRQLWLVVFGVLVVAALAPRRVTQLRSSTPSSLVLESPRSIASRAPEQASQRRVAIDRRAARDVPPAALAKRPEPPRVFANGRYLYLIHQALLC